MGRALDCLLLLLWPGGKLNCLHLRNEALSLSSTALTPWPPVLIAQLLQLSLAKFLSLLLFLPLLQFPVRAHGGPRKDGPLESTPTRYNLSR